MRQQKSVRVHFEVTQTNNFLLHLTQLSFTVNAIQSGQGFLIWKSMKLHYFIGT